MTQPTPIPPSQPLESIPSTGISLTEPDARKLVGVLQRTTQPEYDDDTDDAEFLTYVSSSKQLQGRIDDKQRVIAVFRRACAVFHASKVACDWGITPCPAFHNHKPFEVAETDEGSKRVIRFLDDVDQLGNASVEIRTRFLGLVWMFFNYDSVKTRAWLDHPMKTYGNKTPREIAASDEGLLALEQLIGRLAYGVF